MTVSLAWIDSLDALSKSETDYRKSGSLREVTLASEQLEPAARAALEQGYFLEDVSVVDLNEGLQAVYHFDHWERPGRVTFKVMVPHDKPEIPTISHIHTGADWHERESFDFFGVVFTGHPNLNPLLLPDDLGFHPLIKKPEDRKSLGDIAFASPAPESKPAKEPS